MFPISDDTLSFSKIADYWSREIKPSASVLELLKDLESAWWRGEIVGETALTRLKLIRYLFKSAHDFAIVFVVGDQPGPPETKAPDGTVEVDLGPRVKVPSIDTEAWSDTNCALAYQTLAATPSLVTDPAIGPALRGINLSREAFTQWLARRGYPLPTFWATIETNNDALRSAQNLTPPTALGNSTLPGAEPAAEQRGKRGRPAVSGWELADEPLLNEMASFIANGTARSVHHAAGMVVDHAMGSGTPESKQRRLAKAYRSKLRHGE